MVARTRHRACGTWLWEPVLVEKDLSGERPQEPGSECPHRGKVSRKSCSTEQTLVNAFQGNNIST